MQIRKPIYYIITVFAIGVVVLLVEQYITITNLQDVISGNERVISEYRLNQELSTLQNDLQLLEVHAKTAILTGDSNRIKDFEFTEKKVQEEIKLIQWDWVHNSSVPYMDAASLKLLVSQKIAFDQQLLDHYYKSGKPFLDSTLINQKASHLSKDISALSQRIDVTGRELLAKRLKLIDQSGHDVLNRHIYISIMVLFLLILIFIIVIKRLENQAGLILMLNTSERKLKEAALIKESFLANMSHEIRTPLNAILGYTQLLEGKEQSETNRLHLATIHQSGDTLLAIVNDILDLSKIESGMMRIEKAPFNLNELVRSVTSMFHHKMEEKGLTFKFELSKVVPEYLIGDAIRLTQILVNVLGNAVKFSYQGQIILKVQERKFTTEEIEVEFLISDNGIGVASDKLDTIFERFRQAEESTTRKYGGTGLGLSIVRDLVHLQNGEITIKSELGLGTTVTILIPYGIATSNTNTGPYDLDNSVEFLVGSGKVLVVEDNIINQGLMVQLLKSWSIGYQVAKNGIEAIDFLLKEHFNLVLMDIQMPEMDGYEATTTIRQKLKLDIPIVAMTAHTMDAEKEKCMGNGMNDHISKPIRISELKRILSVYLGNSTLEIQNLHVKSEQVFKLINLNYMREISGNDTAYEKLITEQFLAIIPEQLAALYTAYHGLNHELLKRVAHNLKTSISIMGLEPFVFENLDSLENEEYDEKEIHQRIEKIAKICKEALAEARVFHNSLL